MVNYMVNVEGFKIQMVSVKTINDFYTILNPCFVATRKPFKPTKASLLNVHIMLINYAIIF